MNKPVFTAGFGDLGMAGAIAWAMPSLHLAFAGCQGYSRETCPSPLEPFFSDAENIGLDAGPTGSALRNMPFVNASVDVIAIGMNQKDIAIMEAIASRPGPIVNVDPREVGEFVAGARAILPPGVSPEALIRKYGV